MAFRIPPERRSTYDPNGNVTVYITNDTSMTVTYSWLDYKGDEVPWDKPVHEGETFGQNTNSEHPWLIRDAESCAEIACIVFTASGQVSLKDIQACVCSRGSQSGPGSLSRSRQVASRRRQIVFEQRDGVDEKDDEEVHPIGAVKGEAGSSLVGDLLSRLVSDHRLVGKCTGPSCSPGEIPTISGCRKRKTYELQQPLFGGWLVVFLERGVAEKYDARGLRDMLELDAAEMRRVLPATAIDLLSTHVALWINDSFRYGVQDERGMCCHWSANWLVPNGNMAEKEGCVECYRAADFLDWHATQPAMLLHELCHAYHKWAGERVDRIITEAYDECMASGRYDRGEYMTNAIPDDATWTGAAPSAKPYAATNKCEFFAETCEAFFSSRRFRNDFFPYVHSELRGFDPIAYRMVEDAFGIRGDELATRAEFPEDWGRRFAKVDSCIIMELFRMYDRDGNGKLDADEFAAAVGALQEAPDITRDEVSAAMKVADANKDGVVDGEEFMAWLTSLQGSFRADE